MGLKELQNIRENRDKPKPKKIYYLPKKGAKKIAKEKAEKASKGDEETEKQQWFAARRKEMVGVCQCGCGEKSQKKDEMYYRHSICHIFPQKKFKSIQFHPLNFVERAFFGGCHADMDDRSMDLWPNMADWEDIKKKYFILTPLLTDKERKTKFLTKLEQLINT